MLIVEVADYDNKKFIIVWAPGGYLRPYSSPKSMAKDEKERIRYIRKMSSTITPSEEEKRDLYNLANNVPSDDRVNHEAELTDLNITLIQAYLKEVGSSLYGASKWMEWQRLGVFSISHMRRLKKLFLTQFITRDMTSVNLLKCAWKLTGSLL